MIDGRVVSLSGRDADGEDGGSGPRGGVRAMGARLRGDLTNRVRDRRMSDSRRSNLPSDARSLPLEEASMASLN